MSTNETMLALLEMIGGVEWEEYDYKERLEYEDQIGMATGWWITGKDESWRRTPHEAQNHICMAAIEWLSKDGRWHCIYSPVVESMPWSVTAVTGGRYHYTASGATLLLALHAAVKAVKESKDAEGD